MTRIELPCPYRLVELDCVDSTNVEAKRLAEEGCADYTVVWAKRQTQGRGRRGREWVSKPGNLYFSVVLRPPRPMADVVQLSFVAANALADTIARITPPGIVINVKWPNDVLVDGKKISGILMEGDTEPGSDHFKWVVLGIGVNVASHPLVHETASASTSLAAQGVQGEGLNIGTLLEVLSKEFLAGLEVWDTLGFAPVRHQWLLRAKGIGGSVRVRLPNETLYGTFSTLDESGALVLQKDGKPDRRITAGDVFILEEAQEV